METELRESYGEPARNKETQIIRDTKTDLEKDLINKCGITPNSKREPKNQINEKSINTKVKEMREILIEKFQSISLCSKQLLSTKYFRHHTQFIENIELGLKEIKADGESPEGFGRTGR